MSDAEQFIRHTLPDLFHRGLAELDERAKGGHAGSATIAEDVRAASGAALVHIEGAGSYYVSVHSGQMQVTDKAPADVRPCAWP